jgi:hypothetical protein
MQNSRMEHRKVLFRGRFLRYWEGGDETGGWYPQTCVRVAWGAACDSRVALQGPVMYRDREMVILGTQYAGEMKKGIFSVMHYLMPKQGILSLHSGCNIGKESDVTLFFGLSGVTAVCRALIAWFFITTMQCPCDVGVAVK